MKSLDIILPILRKYSETENYADSLVDLKSKVENPEIVIPFLGTQGLGKSTLINSVLGEEFLPNEADETTCIPVEICFGEKKTAEVHFLNGKIESIPVDIDALREYVDNNYNNGNIKKVKYISVTRNDDILKTGLKIVDLPGVGSLTEENQQTTYDYVKSLNAAVFIMSEAILKTNATFIKNVWKGINTAYFVFNVWDDISESDKNEMINHNKKVLGSIASEIGAEYDNSIVAVNAYAALKGCCEKNDELVNKSNVKELSNKLFEFAVNYKEITKANYEKKISQVCKIAEGAIQEEIAKANMSKEELLFELKKQRDIHEEAEDEINRIERMIRKKIREDLINLEDTAKEISKNKGSSLKVQIYHLIDSGIVDGNMLSDAFSNIQEALTTEACEEFSDCIYKISKELQEDFDSISQAFETERIKEMENVYFYKKQAVKWEKGVQVGINIGMDAGGVALGCVVGDIVAGAIGGAAGGPIGIAVGAVTGLTISLIGALLGKETKKAVLKKRGAEVKSEIKDSVDKYREELQKVLRKSSIDYIAQIEDELNLIVDDHRKHSKRILDEIERIRRDEDDMKSRVSEFERDIEKIVEYGGK